MTQMVRYGDGQWLAYGDYGDRNGYPVLVQHGLIASISDYHLFDRLIESGARLICIARPGYGDSSPQVMGHLAEWGDIVSVLIEALGLASFDMLAMSSGAPYSYAIAQRFPDRVRNFFILSGVPALYDANILACWPYPVNKNASLVELQALARELFFSNLSPADQLRNDIHDSQMNDCFGVAQDLRLRCVDWGFKLSDVGANVMMRHSRADADVPFITAEMTARLLPHCTFEARESDPHFSREVLDDFISTTMAAFYEKAHA